MAEPSAPPPQQRTATLKASYTSPHNAPLTLETTLPIPTPTSTALSVAEKTAYLSRLREAVSSLQGRVNAELTARMEEDAASAAASNEGDKEKKKKGGKHAAAAVVDEEAEEENYGEEVVEED